MKTFQYMILLAVFSVACQSPEEITDTSNQDFDVQELLSVIKQSTTPGFQKMSLGGEEHLIFQPFQNPPEQSAQGGRLAAELNVQFATNQIYNSKLNENIDVYHRSYNGQLVGTTWRIKPGDYLQVDVDNRLNKAKCERDPLDTMHHHSGDINKIDSARFNTTNLHVHGFHVSPNGHADNVFAEIDPGCNFQNRYNLPADHAQGTFWYHGHVHGSTAIQVASGMAGAIIIEGGLDDVPEIKAMEENIFVLQQMPFLKDESKNRYHIPFNSTTFGPNAWQKNASKYGWQTSINGQTIPIITMAPGEAQRWRFVHAGVRETVNLRVFDQPDSKQKLIAQDLYAIAEDGIAYGYTDQRSLMTMQPGYRADLLFKAPERVGDTLYLMDTKSKVLGSIEDTTAQERPKLLAMIVLKNKGSQVAKRLPDSNALKEFAPYPSLVDVVPTVDKEQVVFSIGRNKEGVLQFMIDGKPFDPKNVRELKLGAVQDWQLSSKSGSHPFHIHVNHFQLLGTIKNGILKKFDKPIWKDTYFVEQNEVTLMRTVYKDFTGKFVIHCHILDHEDQGMMQSVEILDSKSMSSALINGITVCGPEEKSVMAIPPD